MQSPRKSYQMPTASLGADISSGSDCDGRIAIVPLFGMVFGVVSRKRLGGLCGAPLPRRPTRPKKLASNRSAVGDLAGDLASGDMRGGER